MQDQADRREEHTGNACVSHSAAQPTTETTTVGPPPADYYEPGPRFEETTTWVPYSLAPDIREMEVPKYFASVRAGIAALMLL